MRTYQNNLKSHLKSTRGIVVQLKIKLHFERTYFLILVLQKDQQLLKSVIILKL